MPRGGRSRSEALPRACERVVGALATGVCVCAGRGGGRELSEGGTWLTHDRRMRSCGARMRCARCWLWARLAVRPPPRHWKGCSYPCASPERALPQAPGSFHRGECRPPTLVRATAAAAAAAAAAVRGWAGRAGTWLEAGAFAVGMGGNLVGDDVRVPPEEGAALEVCASLGRVRAVCRACRWWPQSPCAAAVSLCCSSGIACGCFVLWCAAPPAARRVVSSGVRCCVRRAGYDSRVSACRRRGRSG